MPDIAIDETNRLIASDKVEGTTVLNRQGEHLGTIQNFMVDKRTGRAEYAVLKFGGFLGIGGDHYPVPWDMLTYDVSQSAYVVDIDKSRLDGAPRYSPETPPDYDEPYGRGVYGYWNVPYPIV